MQTNWKPIELAPKDGTFILAKSPGTFVKGKAFVPAVVAWKNGSWFEINDEPGDEAPNWDLSVWMELPESDDGNPYADVDDR